MNRLTVICIAALVSKFVLLMFIARVRRKNMTCDTYYFAYCDGSMRHVVAKEIVPRDVFISYDTFVAYPVLHISRDTIYFEIY